MAASMAGLDAGRKRPAQPLLGHVGAVGADATVLESEAKRQRQLWEDPGGPMGPLGLAAQVLHTQGPAAYVSELKSNLLLQVNHRNSQLATANFHLTNQLNELFYEHLGLQFEYDKLLWASAEKINLLETSGVLQTAQEHFDRAFAARPAAPAMAAPAIAMPPPPAPSPAAGVNGVNGVKNNGKN